MLENIINKYCCKFCYKISKLGINRKILQDILKDKVIANLHVLMVVKLLELGIRNLDSLERIKTQAYFKSFSG